MKKYLLIAIAILITVLSISKFYKCYTSQRPKITSYTEYIVCKDETIWEIANKVRAEKQDIRNCICDIESVNDLKTELRAGDVILIPIYK